MSRSLARIRFVRPVMREILESLLIKKVRKDCLPSRSYCSSFLSASRLRIVSCYRRFISFFLSMACKIARRSSNSNFSQRRMFVNGFCILFGKFSSSVRVSAFSTASKIRYWSSSCLPTLFLFRELFC